MNENKMNSTDKACVCFFIILATVVICGTIAFTYFHVNQDNNEYEKSKLMIESGYEQKYEPSIQSNIWVKIREE